MASSNPVCRRGARIVALGPPPAPVPHVALAVTLTSEDLVIDEDGNVEIVLSATEPPDAPNWMELNDQARRFLIRQGYNNWNTDEEASFAVEVIGGPDPGPVSHMSDAEFLDGPAAAALSAVRSSRRVHHSAWLRGHPGVVRKLSRKDHAGFGLRSKP